MLRDIIFGRYRCPLSGIHGLGFLGEHKVFQESVLAELLARKINVLSEKERYAWLIRILGYMGAATNRSVLSGRELDVLWEPSEN